MQAPHEQLAHFFSSANRWLAAIDAFAYTCCMLVYVRSTLRSVCAGDGDLCVLLCFCVRPLPTPMGRDRQSLAWQRNEKLDGFRRH
jgi:hypothetical protein